MLDEGSGAMEKKLPPRQSPSQPKNNGVISEKKSDYVSNKNGKQRKRDTNNGGRSQEPSQNPRPFQKYAKSWGDKRPRPRGYFNDRQGEEVAEADDYFDVGDSTSSRKGSNNANHLLKFSFTPRGESGSNRAGRGRSGGRYVQGFYKKTPAPKYSREQFLQASCQFVVREDGTYTEQAINPDALVNWDSIELVRTFSTEVVTCPICLQVPFAGKITKCGHTYCWACILHHLDEREMVREAKRCPICPYKNMSASELRSVQNKVVPDYKIGDEIEMKLMRKSKGSVYVSPKAEWKDRFGIPHNMNDGSITSFTKLLMATQDQIQQQVIEVEKAALARHLEDAEEYETCYIEMAKNMLEKREESLKTRINSHSQSDVDTENNLEALFDMESVNNTAALVEPVAMEPLPSDISFDGTKIATQYADAFEDEEEASGIPLSVEAETSSLELSSVSMNTSDDVFDAGNCSMDPPVLFSLSETTDSPSLPEGKNDENESSVLSSSPKMSLPVMSLQPGAPMALTPEEAADHLELPEGTGVSVSHQDVKGRTKDTYYFYQASTGQHIYLNSLNAQCLTKEYGSLEKSPQTIKAQIVAIERIFMTEDVRKRLRYLNHIPLTCEFHVVELKIKPPVVSKETLRHFQPEFEKRRKARQKKMKEEKMRAREQEVEHKKSFGIYPEVQIPLDNLTQFPSHLHSSPSADSLIGAQRQRQDSEACSQASDVSEPGGGDSGDSTWPNTPRSRNDSEGSVSFAAMLSKEGKNLPQSSKWGLASSPVKYTLPTSATMPELRSSPSLSRNQDDDDGGEYLPAPTIASSWLDGITKAMEEHNNRHGLPSEDSSVEATPKAGGKKKKKKEKQLLFSTAMVRKN